ncbi:MAG: serine hydrolase [Bacteroidales bacterium]|nr:serine hydrolase [Bacteroidales bacterium]HNW73124.1 serine hydrolase domain-containing protein [Bacteroidales bacterium]HPS50313.1 serine hydrolase domain-containing protein [Bacteroidales bacterium]
MRTLCSALTAIMVFAVLLTSCEKKENSYQSPTILTREMKAKLEAAADSVFLQVWTPGMIAYFSVEGEGDYIITRGVSNLQTGEPMSLNHYYRIASNTKMFTCLAVLRLADQGLVCIDSTIGFYLPGRNIPNGNRITVRNLANMTSGLFSYTSDTALPGQLSKSQFLANFPPDTLLAWAFRHPVSFDPGTRHDYCNTNTVLLGLLLEKLSGMPAGDAINELVIRPMGLRHTYWPNTIFLFQPYLHGYTAGYGTFTEATNWNPSWGYTAGQIISTIPDMKIFINNLANGTLLSEKMRSEQLRWAFDYGFGLMKTGNWIGHSGIISGYNSHTFYNTVKHITLIILVNMDTATPVEQFSEVFRNILDP